MSHCVRAFVGPRPILELIQRQFQLSRVVDLDQLLALLPLTDELYDVMPGDLTAPPQQNFVLLTPKVVELLKETSTYGIVGYFETDYSGGTGQQGATLARMGEITFGPQIGSNSINQMLELLGARRKASDAFDAVGLGRFRDNEQWINQPAGIGRAVDTVTMTGKVISWFHGFGKK